MPLITDFYFEEDIPGGISLPLLFGAHHKDNIKCSSSRNTLESFSICVAFKLLCVGSNLKVSISTYIFTCLPENRVYLRMLKYIFLKMNFRLYTYLENWLIILSRLDKEKSDNARKTNQ